MKTRTPRESLRHVREQEIDYNISIVYAHVNIRTRFSDTFALVCLHIVVHLVNPLRPDFSSPQCLVFLLHPR